MLVYKVDRLCERHRLGQLLLLIRRIFRLEFIFRFRRFLFDEWLISTLKNWKVLICSDEPRAGLVAAILYFISLHILGHRLMLVYFFHSYLIYFFLGFVLRATLIAFIAFLTLLTQSTAVHELPCNLISGWWSFWFSLLVATGPSSVTAKAWLLSLVWASAAPMLWHVRPSLTPMS